MKKTMGRMAALMICVLFTFCAPLAFAQEMILIPSASIPLAESSDWMPLSIEQVISSKGELVYWIDCTQLPEEQWGQIGLVQFSISNELGQPLATLTVEQCVPEDTQVALDVPLTIKDPMDPLGVYTLFFGTTPAPKTAAELDALLALPEDSEQ